MNKFKVKAGTHSEDGVLYGKKEPAGDVVISPFNLVAMFPQKFEDLGPVSPKAVQPQLQTTSAEEEEEPEQDEDEHPEAKVKKASAPAKKTKRSHHKRRGDWE